MANIGNNIFDNLKQMRRPYVAPEMLVEEILEEREMLAGTITAGNDGSDVKTGESEDEEFSSGKSAKNLNLFWGDDYVEE